jgi:hypothetical protein
VGKAKRHKERGLQRRTAFSAKNIVEHAMSECAKQISRNRSIRIDVLKTTPALLGRVVYVAPKEQSNE